MADILVDSREPVGQGQRKNIVPLLVGLGLSVKVDTLRNADYVLLPNARVPHFVTRKGSDLAQSLFDGHFSDELARMTAEAASTHPDSTCWYIQEGVWAETVVGSGHFAKQAIRSTSTKLNHVVNSGFTTLAHAQVSITTAGIRGLHSAGLNETAVMLSVLVDRARRGWPTTIVKRQELPAIVLDDSGRADRVQVSIAGVTRPAMRAALKEFGSLGTIAIEADSDTEKAYARLVALPNIGGTTANRILTAVR
jgi:ERCC4-type nuclease